MTQIIENKKVPLITCKEETYSIIENCSNEAPQVLPSNHFPLKNTNSSPKTPPNFNANHQFSSNFANPESKQDKNNKIERNNLTDPKVYISPEQKNTKNFIEKKRKRRNKCSYSKARSKKTQKKQNIPKKIETFANYDINCHITETNGIIIPNKTEEIYQKGDKVQNKREAQSKKNGKILQKELIANAEKQFMEKLNKEYSDEQYNKDLDMNLKEERAQFMKENFPIMFRKDKYYLYTILLKKRRTQPKYFIQPQSLFKDNLNSKNNEIIYEYEEPDLKSQNQNQSQSSDEEKFDKKKISDKKNKNKDNEFNEVINLSNEFENMRQNLTAKKNKKSINKEINKVIYIGQSDTSQSEHDVKISEINQGVFEFDESKKNCGLKYKKVYSSMPRQIWSNPKDKTELDIQMFFDECVQVWPFNKCIFVKEIALEYLMRNKYSTSKCLNRLKNFVSFMKKRAEELDFSLVNENEKTVKNYSLRKVK